MKLSNVHIAGIIVVSLLVVVLAWEYWPSEKKEESGNGFGDVDEDLKKVIQALIAAHAKLLKVPKRPKLGAKSAEEVDARQAYNTAVETLHEIGKRLPPTE